MASKRQCKRALSLHEEKLGQYKNVVGMGVIRLDKEDEKSRNSTDAVAVYVRKKVPEDELPPTEVIPRYLEIKGREKVLRVPTKVIEQGEVSLEPMDKESL